MLELKTRLNTLKQENIKNSNYDEFTVYINAGNVVPICLRCLVVWGMRTMGDAGWASSWAQRCAGQVWLFCMHGYANQAKASWRLRRLESVSAEMRMAMKRGTAGQSMIAAPSRSLNWWKLHPGHPRLHTNPAHKRQQRRSQTEGSQGTQLIVGLARCAAREPISVDRATPLSAHGDKLSDPSCRIMRWDGMTWHDMRHTRSISANFLSAGSILLALNALELDLFVIRHPHKEVQVSTRYLSQGSS